VKATPEQAGSRAAEPPGRARRYRWLLFDADGTLFDYDRAEAAALQQTFEQIGAPFRPEHLTEYPIALARGRTRRPGAGNP